MQACIDIDCELNNDYKYLLEMTTITLENLHRT